MDAILVELRRGGRTSFRTREYAALLGKRAYARLVLHRLKLRKELILVKRGWWAFPDAMLEAVACEISKPCYVSFHSALYLHGLTTQFPALIQLAVARNGKAYSILGNKVKEYKVKKNRFNNYASREGLLLASREKAFADCLNVPRACPTIVLKEAVKEVDASKVKSLVSKTGLKRFSRLLRDVGKERAG